MAMRAAEFALERKILAHNHKQKNNNYKYVETKVKIMRTMSGENRGTSDGYTNDDCWFG